MLLLWTPKCFNIRRRWMNYCIVVKSIPNNRVFHEDIVFHLFLTYNSCLVSIIFFSFIILPAKRRSCWARMRINNSLLWSSGIMGNRNLSIDFNPHCWLVSIIILISEENTFLPLFFFLFFLLLYILSLFRKNWSSYTYSYLYFIESCG